MAPGEGQRMRGRGEGMIGGEHSGHGPPLNKCELEGGLFYEKTGLFSPGFSFKKFYAPRDGLQKTQPKSPTCGDEGRH